MDGQLPLNSLTKNILDVPLPGGNEIVWILFYAVLIFAALHALIVLYHWLKYSFGSFVMFLSIIVYVVVTSTLLGVAFFAASRFVT